VCATVSVGCVFKDRRPNPWHIYVYI